MIHTQMLVLDRATKDACIVQVCTCINFNFAIILLV